MIELKKPSVKSKVEAVLFSTGHRISLDEVSRLCRARKEDVLNALKELQKEYDEKQSSLMLVEEGEFWKFTVRDHFISIVRKIVTETELSKSVLETLAVIAFKYPILQSDLIKVRTNKAYDHLVELEKSGYISRQKHGRTNLIKLTEKFFKYFDLTEEKLKDRFKDFESIAKAIKEKEVEIEKIKEGQLKKAEELKKEDEKIRKEIKALDEAEEEFEVPLETYESTPKEIITEEFQKEGNLIVEKEKIGELEVIEEEQSNASELVAGERVSVDERARAELSHSTRASHVTRTRSQLSEKPKEQQKTQTAQQSQPQQTKQIFEQPAEKAKPQKQKKKSEGIKLTPEMEKIVDEKVEQIMGMEKETKEENKEV